MISSSDETTPMPGTHILDPWPLTELTLQSALDGDGLLLSYPGQAWHVSPDLRLRTGKDAEEALRAMPGVDPHFMAFDQLNMYLDDVKTADALVWLHRWKRHSTNSDLPDDAELSALHERLSAGAFGQGLHFLHPALNAAFTAYLAPMDDDRKADLHAGWMLEGLSDRLQRPADPEEKLPWAVVRARLAFLRPGLSDTQLEEQLGTLKTHTPWAAMALLGGVSGTGAQA